MKRLVALISLCAASLVPGGSVALADHCEPEPQCCPTAPHCLIKDAEVIPIEDLCEALGVVCDVEDAIARVLEGGS